MIRGDCPGSSQPAQPETDGPKVPTTGRCPECDMLLGVDLLGRMRAHKLPSERQLQRRREYLEHKSAWEMTHAGGA